jgi:hypothetical protein
VPGLTGGQGHRADSCTLPKALRRNFVPAPDFARAFAEAWAVPGADTLHGELARFLARATGVAVAGTDFDEAALDPHLRMNLRLLGPDRRALGESRDLPDLRARYGERAEQAFARRAGKELAAEGLRDFPREPIPATVPGEAGLPAFPALVDTETASRCGSLPMAPRRRPSIHGACAACWNWRWRTRRSRPPSNCRYLPRPDCSTPRSSRRNDCAAIWSARQ